MPCVRGKKAVFRFLLGAILLSPIPLPAAQTLQILLLESGRLFWETPLQDTTPFILRHCNSIYDARVEERFQAGRQGGLQLTAVKTDSPAVLEYYGLETVSDDWIPLARFFDKISLLVSKRSGLTLLLGPQSLPLWEKLPDGTRIELRIIAAPE